MLLPNSTISTIASAFIESYFNMRKVTWKLEINNDEPIKTPEDLTIKHKIDICLDMLARFKAAKFPKDWIKLIDDLYEKERAEFDAHQNRSLLVRAVTYQPLAGQMFHAVRTWLISQLKNEPSFQELKVKPKQSELEKIKKTLEARNEEDTYFLNFFAETIMLYDPEAKKLNEKSFDDFILNVKEGKRPLDLSLRLLKKDQQVLASDTKQIPAQPLVAAETKAETKVQPQEVMDRKLEIPVVTIVLPPIKRLPPPPPSHAVHSAPENPQLKQTPLQNHSTFAKGGYPTRSRKIVHLPPFDKDVNDVPLIHKRPGGTS